MPTVETYLEFGSKTGNKKKPYDTYKNQDAYDFFMTARYLKDMIAYKTGNLKLLHHKEDLQDSCKKYAALVVTKKFRGQKFYEVGSTLMGAIEGLDYINKKIRKLRVKDITFIGADNSTMINHVAKMTHPLHKLKITEKIIAPKCDLFFAKGVSLLYAITSEKVLCNIMKNAKLSIFDYTFSKGKKIHDHVGTGKKVTFLSLPACQKLLRSRNRELVLIPSKRYYNKQSGKETYECVYGQKKLVAKYFKQYKKIKSKFKIK